MISRTLIKIDLHRRLLLFKRVPVPVVKGWTRNHTLKLRQLAIKLTQNFCTSESIDCVDKLSVAVMHLHRCI